MSWYSTYFIFNISIKVLIKDVIIVVKIAFFTWAYLAYTHERGEFACTGMHRTPKHM